MRGRRGRREEGEHQILLGKLDNCILYSTVSVTVGMHFTCSVVFVPDLLEVWTGYLGIQTQEEESGTSTTFMHACVCAISRHSSKILLQLCTL